MAFGALASELGTGTAAVVKISGAFATSPRSIAAEEASVSFPDSKEDIDAKAGTALLIAVGVVAGRFRLELAIDTVSICNLGGFGAVDSAEESEAARLRLYLALVAAYSFTWPANATASSALEKDKPITGAGGQCK